MQRKTKPESPEIGSREGSPGSVVSPAVLSQNTLDIFLCGLTGDILEHLSTDNTPQAGGSSAGGAVLSTACTRPAPRPSAGAHQSS